MCKITIHPFMTECKGPVFMIRNHYNLTNFSPLTWNKPFHPSSIKCTDLKPLRMSHEKLLPEHRKRGKNLPLLDFMWLYHEKILIRVKINTVGIGNSLDVLITYFSSRRIAPVEKNSVNLVSLNEFFDNFLWISLI